MASVIDDPNGRKRIQFVGRNGKRKTVRLGKATARQAEAFKVRLEHLVLAASGVSGNLEDETARWLADLSDTMYARLAAVGLVKARQHGRMTVKDLLDVFFQHLNVKPITALGYQATKAAILEFFAPDTSVRDVEPLKAAEWRAKMKADGLAEATISKRVKLARQIFRQGVRWKLLAENPFADVRAGSQMNKSRQRYISREDAQKVLDACPDAQWRLLFALSRFGGLRCPSEHLALKWSDVDWERNRFRVTCSKTERHDGRGERLVPIFPELRPYLLAAFEQAEEGVDYVITRYRDANANLRTQLQRIIRKAGLPPWPRLFHNLRSSRQTELAERFPAHVVCAWIGNTERVAQDHYLQVTDGHFTRACGEGGSVEGGEEAAQNAAQQAAAEPRRMTHQSEKTAICGEKRAYAIECEGKVAPTGLEPVTRGL